MRYLVSRRAEVKKIELDMDRVLELYNTPMTTAEVGAIMGCSRSTIDRALARAGVLRKRKRVGMLNGKWRGGRYKMTNGYIAIRVGFRRYRHEHRVVMEQVLGRPLRRGEVVHHKNGDKTDNQPENLELHGSNASHMQKRHPSKRKVVLDFDKICHMHVELKMSPNEIAEHFPVSHYVIRRRLKEMRVFRMWVNRSR